MGLFDAKVVIVTGGGAGIGRGVALGFAAEGAAVSIADRRATAAEATAQELTSRGHRAIGVRADVSRALDAERTVAQTLSAFGRLDVLVNNAGIQPADQYLPVDRLSEDAWDKILRVNLKSQFLMSKFSIPALRRSHGGVIINIASVQGLASMPKVPAYAASKGAILSLTRNMALDYARENIRVVAICPGTIDSAMVRGAAEAAGGDIDASLRQYGEAHPVGRIGQPADIANAAVFLASDRASFVTGSYLCVDGGLMALGAWAAPFAGG